MTRFGWARPYETSYEVSRFLTIDDLDVAGRTVLVRADLNVPVAGDSVTDDFRIRASVPTITDLRDAGAKVVVCSHLGRPVGRDAALRMDPVGRALEDIGRFPVTKLDEVVGPRVASAVAGAVDEVILLENTRFEPGETSNDEGLARGLAANADLFVMDAFGSAHRSHASTVGAAGILPSAAGPLVVSEVAALGRLLEDPPRPYTVVMGGAKVSDKLGVIESLLPRVDLLLIGGGMCFTLLEAEGYEVGKSLVEHDMVDQVREVLESEYGSRVSLPDDIVVGRSFSADTEATTVSVKGISNDVVGLDIGRDTAERFAEAIRGSGSVFWNGPMGVFEWERFRQGTAAVVQAFVGFEGFSVVGGGDSVSAVRQFGVEDDVSHLSTGGGASLEYLEGEQLPGLVALERWSGGAQTADRR